MTKDEIRAALKSEVLEVHFIKADDTIREMKCTLQESFLPPLTEARKLRENLESEDAIAVWDIEKNAWRSFRIDSILRIEFENGDGWINPEMYEEV